MRDGGKGDAPRPLGVDLDKFDNNWDAIFKKPNPLADKMIKQIEEHLNEQQYITPED
jgi:hypothetical protein